MQKVENSGFFVEIQSVALFNFLRVKMNKNKRLCSKVKTTSINSEKKIQLGNNGLEGILKKKWKVYRVSPLHNFDSNKLKFYEKKLNEEINLRKNVSVMYSSKFTLNKNLRLNEQCSESIQVEITKDKCQKVYLGHFISWGNLQDMTGSSIFLPLLLVEGNENEINRVHSTFCKIFDCDIQLVTFSFYALIAFIVKLLETSRVDVDISQEPITLEYKIPGCEKKDRIDVSIFLEATTVVFAIVKQEFEEKFQDITPMEIIWEFYNKLLNHIYQVYKMDLTLAELHKVTFPDAFISADGHVKMSTEEAAKSTLDVLGKFTPLEAVVNF